MNDNKMEIVPVFIIYYHISYPISVIMVSNENVGQLRFGKHHNIICPRFIFSYIHLS